MPSRAARLINFPVMHSLPKRHSEATSPPDVVPLFEFGGTKTDRYHVLLFPDCGLLGAMSHQKGPSRDGPDPMGPNILTPEATVELLERVKSGDGAALERLIQRCLQPLCRWAHGRLPPSARDMQDTADLVQDAVIAALRRLDVFEVRHQGALQAYLRQAVMNRIRDVIRRQKSRPQQAEFPDELEDHGASPLEQAIGAENMRRYDEALERLRPEDREAIVGRLELHYDYEQLALLLDKPSAAAARMAVTRAMRRLADELRHAATPSR